MSWWIDSKAWQALLVFGCLSLYVGIKSLPTKTTVAASSGAAVVKNASFGSTPASSPASKPASSPVSVAPARPASLRRQSLDQTFDFDIATRLSVLPAETEVHLIGVSQGDDGIKNVPWHAKCKKTSNGQIDPVAAQDCHSKWAGFRETETVRVKVFSSRPSILVLMSVNPVKWTVEAADPALIKKVILAGMYPQQVKGLAAETPVEVGTRKTSPACSTCTVVAPLPVAYDEGSKSYVDVLQSVKARTGIDATTFQGSTKAGQFSISDTTPRMSSASFMAKFQISEREIIDKDYRDFFKIANTRISLPEGLWQGLAYQSVGKDYGEDLALVFYQQSQGVLQGIFAVRLKQSLDGSGYRKKKACADKIGYSSMVSVNEDFGDQLCYWVEHVNEPWSTPLFELTAMRLQSRGFEVPSLAINSAFHKAGKNRSITSYYLTNPEAVGILTQSGSWLTSPWHPRKLDADQARKSFVDDKVEWMDAWYQVLKAVGNKA